MTDELTRPELGYVKQPWEVYAMDDFTAAADCPRRRASRRSTRPRWFFPPRYDPHRRCLPWAPRAEALDERYFGLHHDLPPELIARSWAATLVWKRDDEGMWIALIRFNRQL